LIQSYFWNSDGESLNHIGTKKQKTREWKAPYYLKGGVRVENAFLLSILGVTTTDRRQNHAHIAPLIDSIRDLGDGLIHFLLTVAIVKCAGAAIGASRITRDEVRQSISAEAGMTWKQLSAFPGRLRGIAKELERVISAPFFRESDWIVRGTSLPIEVKRKRRFQMAPKLLKACANEIESLANKNLGRKFIGKGKLDWAEVDMVSKIVKECTGKFKDSQVAALINNVAIVLGKDLAIDATERAIRRSRRKKT
jgi:hypothetical protein